MKNLLIILTWATLTLGILGYFYRNLVISERQVESTQRLEENKTLGNQCMNKVHDQHASSSVERKGAYGQFSYEVAYASEFKATTECIIRYPMLDSELKQ